METLTTKQITEILQDELLVALGCTEPIAIALCAAEARSLLGKEPERADVYCSGNIIKNTHSVKVPHANGRKGIPLAAAMGICGGDSSKLLQVLETVDEAAFERACQMVDENRIRVHLAKVPHSLYIRVELRERDHLAITEIRDQHTHFSKKIIDQTVLLDEGDSSGQEDARKAELSKWKGWIRFKDAWELSQTIDFEAEKEIAALLRQQVYYNRAIGREGIDHPWGQEVGRTLIQDEKASDTDKIIAYAAAGSDARMSGCSMPVVINSGSGNQGMTVSIPIIEQAELIHASEDELLRALLLANLMSIHEKHYIGNLSAYCGAVTAAAASSAGLAMLLGEDQETAERAMINTLAISSGMICDGAKASCAGKIAVSLKNAFMGLEMARKGRVFGQGEGILGDRLESTIQNVGRLAAQGMVGTDQEILQIMIGE